MRLRGTTWLSFVCLLTVTLVSAGSYADTQRQLPRYVRLVILHTNDVHGHMLPFDYHSESNVGGVARRAAMIAAVRAQCRDTLLVLEAGDVFTRGPLASVYSGEPDFAVLNAIGYDALTLGNNEFNGADGLSGQKIMFDRIKQTRFPVVCANCTYKSTGKLIVPPYVVLERDGIRIGIFGLAAPRVATYPQAQGLEIEDPIQAAKRVVPILKQEAEVVIGLTHIGYGLDKQLAAQVPDIDIIIGGDSHTWLYKPELVKASVEQHAFWVGGPVIAQDGEWGKCLGSLSAILRLQGEHDYQVMSFSGELVPVTGKVTPSREIESLLSRYTKPMEEKIIGESGVTVSRTEMTGWMADLYRSTFGTQIGIAQVGYFENGINKGPVTELDFVGIIAFGNTLVTGEVPGKALIVAMADAGLAVRGIPSGQQVDPNATYTVCTQDFLSLFTPSLKGLELKPTGKTVSDVLRAYLSSPKSN